MLVDSDWVGVITKNEGKYDISVSHAGWEYLLADGDWIGVIYNTMMGMMIYQYRSGTLNSNTVNLKFHLIRSFFEIFARFLSFHV